MDRDDTAGTPATGPEVRAGPRATPHAQTLAVRFGALVREKRIALGLRQEDLAFATGLGRRFIIELEAGKATCQLGKALAVAAAVGLRPVDFWRQAGGDAPTHRTVEAARG
jgi:DNA-binding XRE family transcriptional regulator